MQGGLVMSKLSVRPAIRSVCLSVKRVDCDKTEKSSAQIFIPYERSFKPNFLRIRMVGEWWGQPLLPEILNQTDPVGPKTSIFNRYSLVAPQP